MMERLIPQELIDAAMPAVRACLVDWPHCPSCCAYSKHFDDAATKRKARALMS